MSSFLVANAERDCSSDERASRTVQRVRQNSSARITCQTDPDPSDPIMTRYFTLSEALDLLPVVERYLREAMDGKARMDEAEKGLQDLHRKVTMMGGASLNPADNVALRKRRDDAVMRVKAACDTINEFGVQIKDLDIGLIDFPTLYHGSEVLLCYRLGEDSIRFWHGTEEGFRGRKPIDQEFIDGHRGSGLH